jgi:hypothetical protein
MEEKMAEKKWLGSAPIYDFDIYDKPCNMEPWFVDGRIKSGQLALMCPTHFQVFGVKLGLGKGQKYDLKTLIKLEG